jgi:tRNA(Arg) A34 adenosine deaminase TadA
MNKNWYNNISISVPGWLLSEQNEIQSRKYLDDFSKMELVFKCAERNAFEGIGAPLAAAVFLDDGSLISVGVDAPGMGGHEMTNALLIASNVLGHQTLRSKQNWEFFSLAPPCLICQGNIFSERPKRFVCAVTHEHLLSELKFPNTPFPNFDWIQHLTSRGIKVDAAIFSEKGVNTLRSRINKK